MKYQTTACFFTKNAGLVTSEIAFLTAPRRRYAVHRDGVDVGRLSLAEKKGVSCETFTNVIGFVLLIKTIGLGFGSFNNNHRVGCWVF